jgi:hypothetical protein
VSFARTNILTAGLSTSYDYDQSQYETVTPDSQAGAGVAVANSRDDDSSRLLLTPLLRLNSNGQDDQFELSVAPGTLDLALISPGLDTHSHICRSAPGS